MPVHGIGHADVPGLLAPVRALLRLVDRADLRQVQRR